MSDNVRHATYTVTVRPAFRAEVVSFISGATLVAYGDSLIDAKRKVDLQLLGEARQRGLTLERVGPDVVEVE